jgi:hypothetical protein
VITTLPRYLSTPNVEGRSYQVQGVSLSVEIWAMGNISLIWSSSDKVYPNQPIDNATVPRSNVPAGHEDASSSDDRDNIPTIKYVSIALPKYKL